MTEKSHVSMAQQICVACTKTFDTGDVLLDTRIKNGELMQSMERYTVTGWGMCPEHQKQIDDGFIVLAGVDANKTDVDEKVTPDNAHRTGDILSIKAPVFTQLFNVPLPDHGFGFCSHDVLDQIKEMQKEAELNEDCMTQERDLAERDLDDELNGGEQDVR